MVAPAGARRLPAGSGRRRPRRAGPRPVPARWWRPRAVSVPPGPRALLDDQQDVAGIDGLAGRYAHVRHRPPRPGLELVLHLHRFDHEERIAGGDDVARAHGDMRDLPGHRRLHDVLAVAERRRAPRPDGVARRLLNPDPVRLVQDLDDEGALLVPHRREVRRPVDQERPASRRGEPGVDVPHVRADRHAKAPVVADDLDHLDGVAHRGGEPHGRAPLQPDRPPRRQAGGPVGPGWSRPARAWAVSAAAISAIARYRPAAGRSPGRIRSRSPVERRPAVKSGWASTRRSTGIVERTPTIRYSSSARAMRPMAVSRSAPQQMSLATRVS